MITIPDDMDVPLMRRDTSKRENLHWLLRNLHIRSGGHKDFERIRAEILEELRKPNTICPFKS